jgi:streptogramin lyase
LASTFRSDPLRLSACTTLSALLFCALLLTGCALNSTAPAISSAGPQLRGNVHGGSQAVVGAHIYLFAAGTSGYGGASTSLLTSNLIGTDTLGGYTTTDSNGAFTVSSDYTCTSGTQIYILATGGNPGLSGSQTNSNLALMSALGQCPTSGSLAAALPTITINEVTTAASVYALSGFMTDLTHVSSSGTALSNLGMANAFVNVPNLVSLVTGAALATTPAGNGTAPQSALNTVANILSSCVNTVGATSAPCSTLFSSTLTSGQSQDTVTAALMIAQHPGANIAALFALNTAQLAFNPALPSVPTDFTLALMFSGGGLLSPEGLAIDSIGNVWVSNYGAGISEFSAGTGAALSGSSGFTGGGLAGPQAVAIDQSGSVWAPNFGNSSITKLNGLTGAAISGNSGYTGGGLSRPTYLVVDGSGDVWAGGNASYSSGTNVSKLSGSTGLTLAGTTGYTGGGLSDMSGLAIDHSGNVWIANGSANSVIKFGPSGSHLSGVSGYTGGGLNSPGPVAIDSAGNVWTGNFNNSVTKLNGSTGAAISLASGYTGGGLNDPVGIAIDGLGNVWTANQNNSVTSLNGSTGAAITPSTGYTNSSLDSPTGVAIDGSGNLWIANFEGNITEFVGVAAPVVTPIAAGVANNTLGSRP